MGSVSRMLSRLAAIRVTFFVNFAGVEWGVMVIADGEGDDVSSRWL